MAAPVAILSSGICARPSFRTSLGPFPAAETPPMKKFPFSTGLIPVKASASSLCPFPSIAAMPNISPALTFRLMPFTAISPLLSATYRSSASMNTSPGLPVFSILSNKTSLPTIMEASIFSFTFSISSTPTSLPRRITPTLSEMDMTSYSLWVMIMTVIFFSLTILLITANNSSVSCGVRTAVGSSSMSISAPL